MINLEMIEVIIQDRMTNPREGSYTNELLNDPARAAQKVGEEAVEVVVAALAQGPEQLIHEVADLFYHTSVVMAQRGVGWEDIWQELSRRHQSK